MTIKKKYTRTITAIKSLQSDARYQGAILFGSVRNGFDLPDSDVDVIVMTNKTCDCSSRNDTAMIKDIPVDISFLSPAQFKTRAVQPHYGHCPIILEADILFDKNGVLAELKNSVKKLSKPPVLSIEELETSQYGIQHTHEKIRRHIARNPKVARLYIQKGLITLIDFHYRLHRKWRVSFNRLLPDLKKWDRPFAAKLATFLNSDDIRLQYTAWNKLAAHVIKASALLHSSKNKKTCRNCRQDIEKLTNNI